MWVDFNLYNFNIKQFTSIFEGTFQVRLLGGKTPNMGRVVVRYDDVWSDVCFESKASEPMQWSFSNVQVVCRELGFPGAMFARPTDGQDTGLHQSTVSGYVCKDGRFSLLQSINCENILNRFVFRCRKVSFFRGALRDFK